MGTETTSQVAKKYFDAWTNRKGADVLRDFLDEDFVFAAGPLRVEGRETFLASGEWPENAVVRMVSEIYQDDAAFQLNEATNGEHKVRIAEHLTLKDGRISHSEAITDGAAFGAFMAG